MTTPIPHGDETSDLEDQLPPLQADSNILKSPDLMIWSDPSADHFGTPPARLNSRFYRPATNRRRSSAASSRRNSLSSSHSHHSHHSNKTLRNAYQSNYIAQHLRRASILEDRRARLQDRAAHVEQVRLRAALAKAIPKTTNTEEKAVAAQQAREHHLAKVAAACAEEVNRAKKVVEDMKERRAAEERRVRLEIEEKHAEAERRRQEYLNTPRKSRASRNFTLEAKEAKKAAPVVQPVIVVSQEVAAVRLQKGWRRIRGACIAKRFQELNLSIEAIQQSAFPVASAILCKDQVIDYTKKVLNALQLDTGSKNDSNTVRTFLSAYMVLGHPTEIFSNNGQQEQDLIDKAKETLVAFESALSLLVQPSHTPSEKELSTLHQAYTTYVASFEAWKKRDASVLIGTMIDQFVALDVIWQAVKDDSRGEVAGDYRDGIRENQVILLAKIKKLAGAERANLLIKKAIRESRRRQTRQLPQGDIRPRPLEAESTTSSDSTHLTIDEQSNVPEEDSAADDAGAARLSSVFSIIPPNRIVVHELMIDPAFKIEVSPQSDVRNVLNRSVCDSMRSGVAARQGDVWTVAVAENIRTRLLKLLKPGNSMHTMLAEALDSEHIRNQCRLSMFSYDKFFTFMADLLPRLCAPFRDVEVKALADVLKSDENNGNVDVMIEKLFGLLHMIDLMSLDYTNYMIQQAAPTLIREGPGYEQRMFASDLQSDVNGLQRTKRWWRDSSIASITDARTTQSSSISPTSPQQFNVIYSQGLLTLALEPQTLAMSDVPETLALDHNRLSLLRKDTLRYIVTSAVLLTAKNLLKRDVRAHWKSEAKRILDTLTTSGYDNHDGELAARVHSIVESGKAVPPSSSAHLSTMIARFLSAAQAISGSTSATGAAQTLTDPLLTLLLARLRTHIFARLTAVSSRDKVRLASTASEQLASIGMAEFVGEVAVVVEVLEKVRTVDLAAHRTWYGGIAEEVESGTEGGEHEVSASTA